MDFAERITRRFIADQIADPQAALAAFRARNSYCFTPEKIDRAKAELPRLREWVDEKARADADPNLGPHTYVKTKQIADELTKTWSARTDVGSVVRTGMWFTHAQAVAQLLFRAILQQYLLPPSLRKSIEAASNFWSKKRVNAPKIKADNKNSYAADIEYIEAYLKIADVITSQESNAEAAITKGELHSDPAVAARTKIHTGSFDVVNTGGFDDATMRRAVEVIEKVEHALTSHGLGKVCYGDILLSNSIKNKKSVLAFYMTNSDEMFVRADVPVDEQTIETICHELGHRLFYKFLRSKAREVQQLYRVIDDKEAVGMVLPEPGGTYETPDGHKLKIIGVNPRKKSVQYQDVDGPQNRYTESPVEYWAKLIGKPTALNEEKFVSPYARAGGPDENFAEMVAYYVLDRLPKNQIALLEPLLFL